MADPSYSSHSGNLTTGNISPAVNLSIPPQLKFLISNIKTTVVHPLSPDTHQIWRSQIFKLFKANGYEGFLTGDAICPPRPMGSENPTFEYTLWNLIDQNLASALYATISPSILPYVINLSTCPDIWHTIDKRLQSSNRSRILQLKNELHSLTMGNRTMAQYLSDIKSKVDLIAAAGFPIDSEDIIYYTLNGLSSSYQNFKVAVRTNLQPISLDDLYSLLCSEETLLQAEAAKEASSIQTTALHATPSDTRRTPPYRSSFCGRGTRTGTWKTIQC